MPGRHLSNLEQKLDDFWDSPPAKFKTPLLRSLEVSVLDPDDTQCPGFRGIRELQFVFRYPVTCICGGNGVGKSTILALTALAHKSPKKHRAHLASRHSYTFQDFFARRPAELPLDGMCVTWRAVVEGEEVACSMRKTPRRWTSYEVRTERVVTYVPLGRILPPQESGNCRTTFEQVESKVEDDEIRLDDYHLGCLGRILGRRYSEAVVLRRGRQSIHYCSSGGAGYSGFNMGGGECGAIEILALVQQLPVGSLMVVEELEAALHPEAQRRLVETLLDISQRRRIQFVFTTHSEIVLDALPRKARVLVQRSGPLREPMESPSTRFAVSAMSGQVLPEVMLFCEDSFARALIEECLNSDARTRVKVVEVGNNTTVIRQGVAHRRAYPDVACLCVLDGDCSESEIAKWMASENPSEGQRPEVKVLPGSGLSPEKWAVRELSVEGYSESDYPSVLSVHLGLSRAQVMRIVESAAVEPDHHSLGYVFSQRTNIEESQCVRYICRALSQHPQLEEIRSAVEFLLS